MDKKVNDTIITAVEKLFPSLQEKLTSLPFKIAVMVGASAALLCLFIAPMAGIFSWVERRVAGRIQHRIGPNRVGPIGILQFLADGIKMILKEDIVPDKADKPLFRFAPYLVVTGMFAVLVVVPFSPVIVFSDLNVGILYILAVASMAPLGIIMAGWASNNKWSQLGGLRSTAQIISYEVPAALAVLSVVILTGSLSIREIILAQSGGGGILNWYVFRTPFTFISFFIFFISIIAELNRLPFDIAEAESELVSGYNTEYSGIRFGLFFLAEWANLFIGSALVVSLFLGGWVLPEPLTNWLAKFHPLVLNLAHVGYFIVKSLVFVFIIMLLRWTLPRLRVDQLMAFCWKFLIPLAFFNVLGVAAWVAIQGSYREQITAQGGLYYSFEGVKWVLLILAVLLLLRVFTKFLRLTKEMKEKYYDWVVKPPEGGKA